MTRYALSHNRHGWAVHIRDPERPEVSLCKVALQTQDFGTNTEVCRNCARKRQA